MYTPIVKMKAVALLLSFLALASAGRPVIDRFMRPTGIERFQNLFKAIEFDRNNRIVGGVESIPHSRPFQVGLFLTVPGGTAFCGGSLVARNIVLTAAHCVNDGRTEVSLFTVVLGAHNIFDEANSLRYQSTNAVMHPDWNPSLLQNDIAVIYLPTNVVLNDRIQLISMPPRSSAGNSFVLASATVSGWGRASDDVNVLSENLRETTDSIITNTVCNVRYLGVIESSHICLNGDNGRGSCNGDSGGPLTTMSGGRLIEIGIVSFGIVFGCEAGWPSVYTRTTSYLDWLDEVGVPIIP